MIEMCVLHRAFAGERYDCNALDTIDRLFLINSYILSMSRE